ncbi:MAG: integration host factor subunit beta [Deltaproteobacteria bacterium]|nr:MAG: integration host factor subunit beta [Deltaproteobacteria bacterium]RLA85733.1 MAG: integration host factor subunit beta [Deltaproteobacteria bacterium]
MTKGELTKRLAEKAKVSQREAKVVVDAVFEEMEEAMLRGERIEIRGFGSFVLRSYDSYQGRNPKTGERINVPPKRLPYFKVGKELRERVNRR